MGRKYIAATSFSQASITPRRPVGRRGGLALKTSQKLVASTLIGVVTGFLALAIILDIEFGGIEAALVGGVLVSLTALLATSESKHNRCCWRKRRTQTTAPEGPVSHTDIPMIRHDA